MRFPLTLITTIFVLALGARAPAENVEDQLTKLIGKALSFEGRPLAASELEQLGQVLVEIEEKIMYLQGIGGEKPISFLVDHLVRIEKHQEKLERPRQVAHGERQRITERMGEIKDKLTTPGTMDTKVKMALEAELKKLEEELSENVALKSPITVYWLLVRGVTGFGGESALSELADVLKKHKDSKLASDIMFGLQGNRAPGLVDVYEMVLQKCDPELAIMAAEQLGFLKQEQSIDVLVAAFKRNKKSPAVQQAIGNALERLTGQPHGADGDLWKGWWKGAQEVGVEKTESGLFVKAGEAETSVAEKRNPDVKVLVLTQRCPKNGTGEFDEIQYVCRGNGIAFDEMQKEAFNEQKPDLSGYSAILVNCTQYRPHCHGPECKVGNVPNFRMRNCTGPGPHDEKAHRLDPEALARIKSFVKAGGYLFTEDWGLIEITRELFPQYITSWPRSVNSSDDFLRAQDVDVNPPSGVASHHLLRGVYQFHDVSDSELADAAGATDASVRVDKLLHKWHIDDLSPALIVLEPSRVTTLLTSNNVADLTGTRGACAVTFFPFGTDSRFMYDATTSERAKMGGRVLHILSHFTKQSKVEDERAVKRLLLNFIEEAAWAWDARQRRGAKKN